MSHEDDLATLARVSASAIRREVEAERIIESLACALFDGGDPVAAFDQWQAWKMEMAARGF